MGLKPFPDGDEQQERGRILNFTFPGGAIIRPIAEEDPTRAAERAAYKARLQRAIADHIADFTTFQPVTREEWDKFFEMVNRYVMPLVDTGSLFRNPTQEIMVAVIEGIKNAHREQYRVHAKKKPDGRMDIPGSLLVLQTHEGLRTLAELFYQKTGMNLWLLFLRQFEEGRLRVMYRLKHIQNRDQDGWKLKLEQKPSGITTELTVRPRQQALGGLPPLACFVLLPEPREEDGEDGPEGPMIA